MTGVQLHVVMMIGTALKTAKCFCVRRAVFVCGTLQTANLLSVFENRKLFWRAVFKTEYFSKGENKNTEKKNFRLRFTEIDKISIINQF